MQKLEYKLYTDFTKTIDELLDRKNINTKNDLEKETIEYINSITIDDELKQKKLINKLVQQLLINTNNVSNLEIVLLQKVRNKINQNVFTYLEEEFIKKSQKKNKTIAINYKPLQELLIQKNFQEADRLTQTYLCKLAEQKTQTNKQWLYFTDITLISSYDIFIIDILWQIYSDGKFGLCLQRKIWMNNNKNWDTFFKKVGWVEKDVMKRYPNDFTWNINAPNGHLPLFNQLRGVQVLSHLFQHNVWKEYYDK
uniref:GUN4-like domain-containing protein n=1 Tax=Platysiphonia delicata TaxID=2006979 RepID=A0A1Z1M0U9_9FLOR|nr:hypothetical protein [Platysiphonia delicata]ARW59501.1 hypothetical protein [Platysiphonia delicata]